MSRTTRTLLACAAGVSMLAGGSAGAKPKVRPVELVRMSETAPDLSGCFGGANDVEMPGRVQLGAETEPSLAINPSDPDHLVGAWQLNKSTLETGGAQTDLVGVSEDGGKTWQPVLVPGLSKCTGGPDALVSDPWVSIGPDGAVYLSSLFFPPDDVPVSAADGIVTAGWEAGVQVSVSPPGARGLSWEPPVVVKSRDDKQFHDRPAVAAHPTRPGVAHVAFVTHAAPYFLTGALWASSTHDGGRTWRTPTPVAVGTLGLIGGTTISVVDDGTAHGRPIITAIQDNDSQFLQDSTGRAETRVPKKIQAYHSEDGGLTWRAQVLAEFVDRAVESIAYRAVPVHGTTSDGTVYAAWQHVVSRDSSTLHLRRSDDGGLTWAPPVVVATVPAEIAMTAVAAKPGGEVGVTFYDFRNDLADDDGELVTDVWFAHSRDAGQTWSEHHLAGPFDFTDAPSGWFNGAPFLGHYIASVPTPRGFASTLPLTSSYAQDGPDDLYLANIRTGGPAGDG